MKSNVIVIGPHWRKSATRMAVFGDVANGSIANAHYIYPGEDEHSLKRYLIGLVGKLKIKYGNNFLGKAVAMMNISIREVERLMSEDRPNIIVYTPSTHILWSYRKNMPAILRKLHPDSKHVFYLIDGVQRTAEINRISVEEFIEYLKQFDCVCTYDREDSQKYGYEFAEVPITHFETDQHVECKYDIYFSGRSKGRSELLCAIQNKANEKNLKCSYRIVAPNEAERALKGMKFSGWVDYACVVDELKECNCLIDMSAGANSGTTLRSKEAILYNKKLLTMNPQVKQMKYYDPRWMHVFENADDIDYEWAGKRENIDYNYEGDYSPRAFFEQLERKLFNL